MHHRRNRTNRRENKRLDSKRFRQAEREAMDRPPSVPPADHWGYRTPELPIPDDSPSNGKARSRRVVPKKERCPQGGSHSWVREWTEVKDMYRKIIKGPCAHCEAEHEDWKRRQVRYARLGHTEWLTNRSGAEHSRFYGCQHHGEKVFYTIRNKKATCLKCKKSKVTDRDSDAYDLRWGDHRKKLTLPKRPVKF